MFILLKWPYIKRISSIRIVCFTASERWTDKDYQAVAQWLNRTPDSPEKASVASAYAAKTYPYDPAGAAQWLQTIPPGPDRTKALETIYQAMPKNSAEAKAFASQYGLTK